MKKLIIIMFGMLLLSLVSAETETYPVNKEINLKFTCTLNNAIPDSSAEFNITISYPNGTTYIDNKNATPLGNGAFNYTTTFTELGLYRLQMFCYNGTYSYSDEGYYEITPLGDTLSTSQSIIYFIFLIASIGLFFLCLYYSVKIEWKHQRDEDGYVINVNDLRYIKIFTIAMSYVTLLFIAGILRSITANYIPEIGVYRIFELMYWLLFSAMYPIMVCAVIFALVIFVSNKKFQKAIDMGVPIE